MIHHFYIFMLFDYPLDMDHEPDRNVATNKKITVNQ